MKDMDCLSNTVLHRQWSLCIGLFSRDEYSSGALPTGCLLRRMEESKGFYKTYKIVSTCTQKSKCSRLYSA